MSEKQYVVFELGGQEYGIDIISVQEIILPVRITKLPNLPAHVLGVFNLRGSIITLLDLRLKFGLEKSEQTEDTRYIVFKAGEKAFGILADRVQQVVKIEDGDMEKSTDISTVINQEYICGVARVEQKLVIILKLEATI